MFAAQAEGKKKLLRKIFPSIKKKSQREWWKLRTAGKKSLVKECG